MTTPGRSAHDILDRIGRKGKAANMGCEGGLAQIRQASPCIKQKPNARRVLHAGHLSQHLKLCRDRGFEFKGRLDLRAMVKHGAPVRANTSYLQKLL